MAPPRDSKLLRTFLIIFFVLLTAYALYEAWGMLFGPVITVPEEAITVTEAYTLIRGHAERITELRLNGKPIPVTENGDFEEPYLLAEGSNYLILEARDARGRMTQETLTIFYKPPPSSPPVGTTTPE
jgi:hypothetical protein